MFMRRSTSKVEGVLDSPRQPRRSTDIPNTSTLFGNTHRAKPFLEALYKAIELNSPETLDWTSDVVYLEAASRSNCLVLIFISFGHACILHLAS